MLLLLVETALVLASLTDMTEDEIDYLAFSSMQAGRLEDAAAAFREMVRRDEADAFARVRDAVKRPLYGCDCYAYGLVASGFGADLVVEADLGLYDYTALVPVLLGAGGCMTDWNGVDLTIAHHEASKGRVLATANKGLHAEAMKLLQIGGGTKRKAGE